MRLFILLYFLVFSNLCNSEDNINPCEGAKKAWQYAACDKYLYEQQDLRLNEVYSKLIEVSRYYFNVGSADVAGVQSGGAVVNSLRDAQRKWIIYRDANCRYAYDTHYPGTQASNVLINCKKRMTEERADELEREYKFWSSK